MSPARGGHAIPDADITRRFPRSLRNLFEAYSTAVDEAHCILNDQPVPSQGRGQRPVGRLEWDEDGRVPAEVEAEAVDTAD